MNDSELTDLLGITEARELFHGGAREAGQRFPSSLNVASALALATGCRDLQVKLRADPGSTHTRHEIHATHPLGEYRFTIDNAPSASRPSTSAVTAHGVIQTLQLLIDPAARVL
jgi:aspartate dehydrogenase